MQAVKLTPRERQVIEWAGRGKSSWEIARILDCSEATVNFHFSNIRRKFAVTTRSAALLKALEQGLITLS